MSQRIYWVAPGGQMQCCTWRPYEHHMTVSANRMYNAALFAHGLYYRWTHVYFLPISICVDFLILSLLSQLCSNRPFLQRYEQACTRHKKQIISVLRDQAAHPPDHRCSNIEDYVATVADRELFHTETPLDEQPAYLRDTICSLLRGESDSSQERPLPRFERGVSSLLAFD